MLTSGEIKKITGIYAAGFVKQGMLIGLGTGTTVYWLIQELGNRVKEGLQLTVVPTSTQTKILATELDIPVAELNDIDTLSLTIDGADEVDANLQLIKGGGGALLQEKMVAAASNALIIIADESKMVTHLGAFPLPVEVIPFGWKQAEKKISSAGCKKVVLRQRDNQAFVTDNGHYILDCWFEKIENATSLNTQMHLIPGVVETGLFIDMATTIITGYADGRIETIHK